MSFFVRPTSDLTVCRASSNQEPEIQFYAQPNQTMEPPPIGWPNQWDGETLADIGNGQKLFCTISLQDGHTATHFQNYSDIASRWEEVWPAARDVIQSMLERYDRDTTLDISGNSLLITIPAKRIERGVHWSIALQNRKFAGVWDASFEGWWVRPEKSQPYF